MILKFSGGVIPPASPCHGATDYSLLVFADGWQNQHKWKLNDHLAATQTQTDRETDTRVY